MVSKRRKEGKGEAIARNLYEMSALKVPILSIVIGEGGSGGALAFGVSNEVWMLENSIYSVISPEGFASIIWKDGKKADEAAGLLKLTANDLEELNIIEKVIEEPEELTIENMDSVIEELKEGIEVFLDNYTNITKEEIVASRYKIQENVRRKGSMYKPLVIGDLKAKLPIIQGGMGVGISLSNLAATVSKLGGIGVMSTAQIGYTEADFRKNP